MNALIFHKTVEITQKIMSFEQPADACLSAFFKANNKLGRQDRAEIAQTVFAVLRHYEKIQTLLTVPLSAKMVVLCGLMTLRGFSVSALQDFCNNEEKQLLIDIKQHKNMLSGSLNIQAELPNWLIDALRLSYTDDEIIKIGQAMSVAAPLDLRVNILKNQRDKVLKQLQDEGFQAAATPFSPWGIRLIDKSSLHKHPLFLDGTLEVQDEGSQLLSLLSGAKRGLTVVDFCAGAGGKTLAMGALMHNKGRLYAFDISEKRLNNLKPRLMRSGLGNVLPQVIENEHDSKLQRLRGKADIVLVDAPCSGTGTLRRNPDIKYRQSPEKIARIIEQQSSIFQAASQLVASNGRLIYATCSLLTVENERQVEQFLQQNPQVTLENANNLLQPYISLPSNQPMLRLNPAQHGTDGFFAAVLTKNA
ncbi:MAG: RsmB/NOP family class I SAM-dependent RNA methyltransferase [Neisseriaceae bacterium]|nr:RsmB/NOP family class I SAM-dependent RNA methyltransferase [Neisseriaceae bacterium]